ncbi:hypothetical protein [Paenibacillus kobensis]|uniref:hypothetical protein n=1 Tax=Paenibacillus kobensis TaxID=59841 RepID=UPI000FD76CFB|nr:hypothetical protein [Paenibacillus kobensis]
MQQFGDRFYCVSCGQLMEMKNAEILFRTGYFRVVHPLGCCIACEMEQSYADALPDHQRLNADRNTAHIGPTAVGLAGEESSAACELPGLSGSWYQLNEEDRLPVIHMNLH